MKDLLDQDIRCQTLYERFQAGFWDLLKLDSISFSLRLQEILFSHWENNRLVFLSVQHFLFQSIRMYEEKLSAAKKHELTENLNTPTTPRSKLFYRYTMEKNIRLD